MKKLLLALAALAFCACAQDTTDEASPASPETPPRATVVSTPRGAVAGMLSIEVSPEMADRIEAATAQTTRSGGPTTRSGVSEMDLVFNKIGVERFQRMFPYEERFEARHRAFGLHRWYTIRFDKEADLAAAADMLSGVEGVSTVQYRHRIVPLRRGKTVPYNKVSRQALPRTRAEYPMNDPKLVDQWHYHNIGDVVAEFDNNLFAGKAGADIDLFDAWKLSTGSPEIIVAVLDEPVQYTHADLAANMWTNPNPGYTLNGKNWTGDLHGFNFYNGTDKLDWTTAYRDPSGWIYADHGTHVAGTIAAVNGNGTGVCGIAGGENGGGGVKIMTCQILGYDDTNYQDDAGAKAFVYAADRGALIAQCSWGYSTELSSEADWVNNDRGAERRAIDYFIANAGADDPDSPLCGGLVIFAAGNDGDIVGDQTIWPGAYTPTLAVAAMSPDYTPAYYTDYGDWVDITAPGGDEHFGDEGMVLSTILDDPAIGYRDGRTEGYGFMQGTSMACPHVSGVAALGLSYAAKLGRRFTPEEYKTLLMSSVRDLNFYMTGTRKFMDIYGSWATMQLSGYKNKMGTGYIDAYRLLLGIQGTPSIYVQKDKNSVIDLEKFFGGGAAYEKFKVEVPAEVQTKLGMSAPTLSDGKLSLTCSRTGVGTITLSTTVGETALSKELAVVVREAVAGNGGWL